MENKDYKYVDFDFEALEACPFCGNKIMISNGKVDWCNIGFWYVICPQCGLKYMNPRPTQESYKNFYKNLFWEQKVRNLGFHQKGQLWQNGTNKPYWDSEEEWDSEEGRKKFIDKHKKHRVDTIIPVISKYKKLDQESNRAVSFDEAKSFAFDQSCEYIEVSAKENIRVIDVFDKIFKLMMENE